ncbi:DUF1566 domain-containing protein [Candidatus Parcubacteria bacterium]|nr:DUF1566 domain-containing protein [Patescibacteria group bacterium]MBU4309539.1 DUF1566 domain-containing protein [Patescibacteria group bacterium]MBU4432531.1 DUF1566 domain-containing protein [Patescibacteria group bacterium]MBU4578073.1 DUF1566 domain-containing protein [Patescibacteria group bacterium]MCG2696419.1 DUF1566 domain-containing protein [Candidatus Parcubacteria bacterium]
MFKSLKSKTIFRIPTVALIAAVAVLAGGAVVWGVMVSDTFTSTSKVAATWQTTVATSTGEVTLKEQSCDNGPWFCADTAVCTSTLADGNGLLVARTDVSPNMWKNVDTACDPPQCSITGGQTDNLVADNTVIFGATYPAREACKALGGRLPTKDELSCIYTNRATFGNNFISSGYWSSTESSAAYAWLVFFNTGTPNPNFNKSIGYYVRCVRGWSN